MFAPPERTTTATKDIEHDTTPLTKTHDNQVAVWTPLGVVSHLLGAVHGTLVRRYAPLLSTVHGPVLDIFIAAGLWVLLGVESIADLADRLDDVARVRRGRAACEEVVEGLAFVRLERLKLGAVFELGTHSEGGACVEKRR